MWVFRFTVHMKQNFPCICNFGEHRNIWGLCQSLLSSLQVFKLCCCFVIILHNFAIGPENKLTEWKYKTQWILLPSRVPSQQEQFKLKLHIMFLYLLPITSFISDSDPENTPTTIVLRTLQWQPIASDVVGTVLFIRSLYWNVRFLNWSCCMAITIKGTSSSHYFCVCSHLKKADFHLFLSNMSEDVMFCFQKLIIYFCICLIFLNPVQIWGR
jgi:hypothetical protein